MMHLHIFAKFPPIAAKYESEHFASIAQQY
jgi:hypothetical protein